jgi:Flp pilus assembly protein TadD
MQPERSALSHIVESVADGSGDVDWDALEADLPDERDRQLVRQLRILARISEVHRSVDEGPDTPPDLLAGGTASAGADLAAAVNKVIGRIEPRGTTPMESGPGEPRPMEPVPATVTEPAPALWGPLQLQEKVGEGTFGEVFRAFDTQLHREIAVKLLRVGSSPDRLVDRMLREGRVLARVHHPNVVVVHGAEVREGRAGLSMEFIRGATLERLLKTQGTFSAREAALIGQDLCRAVAAVHGAGLVHRDIKAQNVMREEGGRVVLMDFGAGQLREAGARGPARLTGTPLYLAPEILNGSEATVQSDIYSLGVLLYHLVTGEFPVRANAIEELRVAHAEGRAVRLHDARPDLPDGFVQVVERACEPSPDRRYQSAGEVQVALRGALEVSSQSLRAAAPAVWTTMTRTARGRLTAACAALVVVGLASVLALWPWERRSTAGVSDPGHRVVVAILPVDHEADVPAYVVKELTTGLTEGLMRTPGVEVIAPSSARIIKAGAGGLREASGVKSIDFAVEARLTGPVDKLEARLAVLRWRDAQPLKQETLRGSLGSLPGRMVSMIGVTLERTPVAATRTTPSPKDDAVDLVAQARFALEHGPDRARRAATLFKQAIAVDGTYARAHSGLARAYLQQGCGVGAEPARTAATDAARLDPNLSEAHTVLADVAFVCDWSWADAERDFTVALGANPGDEMARTRYAMFLAARGRPDEAFNQILIARQVDPFSTTLAVATANVLLYNARFAEAEIELARALAADPQLATAYTVKGKVLAARQDFVGAARAFAQAVALDGSSPAYYAAEIAAAEAGAKRTEEARRALGHLEAAVDAHELSAEMVAFVHVRLGDADAAFRWLDRAVEERSARVLWLAVDPRAEALRPDPRFKALLARLDLSIF